MRKLDGIFFDVDDTLYSSTEFARKARRNACRAMIAAGLDYPEDKLFEELEDVISEFSSNYEQHFDKLLLRIPQSACRNCTPAVLIASAVVAYHNTKHREMFPYDDAVNLLERLARVKGLVRGIITAGKTVKQAEKIVRLGLAKYLTPRAVFITEETGITKQNPKLYLLACERFSLDPGRTMYVGDNPEADVDAPNEAGMITVLHRRDGKHRDKESRTRPDYVINNHYDLMDILVEDFGLPLY